MIKSNDELLIIRESEFLLIGSSVTFHVFLCVFTYLLQCGRRVNKSNTTYNLLYWYQNPKVVRTSDSTHGHVDLYECTWVKTSFLRCTQRCSRSALEIVMVNAICSGNQRWIIPIILSTKTKIPYGEFLRQRVS